MTVALAIVVVPAAPAWGSNIIGRNASNVKLAVDAHGRALVSYRQQGWIRRVVAWGALNDQTRFKLDYTGGRRAFRGPVSKTITRCGRYDGPALGWLVAACKAPDGSYWALQSWRRLLPNQGHRPWLRRQSARELHLSHWRGPLPELEIYRDWVYGGRFHHLFGRYRYLGKGVHGYASTRTGVPLDPYGRNIYLDTYNSRYGRGWRRENSFLAHRPNGTFCYGFFPRRSRYDGTRRPAGSGERYRATAVGPGVAPDPVWTHVGLGAFDARYEADMNAFAAILMAGDPLCRRR